MCRTIFCSCLSKGNLNPHNRQTCDSAVSGRNIGFLLRFEGKKGVVRKDSSSLCESLQMVFINILYSLKPSKNMIWVHFLAFSPLICARSRADSYLHIYKYWAVQWGLPLPKTTLFQQHRMPGREQSHPPWQSVLCLGGDGEPHHLHLHFIHIEKQTSRLAKTSEVFL